MMTQEEKVAKIVIERCFVDGCGIRIELVFLSVWKKRLCFKHGIQHINNCLAKETDCKLPYPEVEVV